MIGLDVITKRRHSIQYKLVATGLFLVRNGMLSTVLLGVFDPWMNLATAKRGLHYFLGRRTFTPRPTESDILYDYTRRDNTTFLTHITGRVFAVDQIQVRPYAEYLRMALKPES